jgi:cytidylate kinase
LTKEGHAYVIYGICLEKCQKITLVFISNIIKVNPTHINFSLEYAMAVITISRDPGASGEEIAVRLAGRIGFVLIDKSHLVRLWREMDLDETSLASVDEKIAPGNDGIDSATEAIMRMLPDLIVQMAEDQELIVLGRGAQGLFRNRPGTLHLRVVAPRSFRVRYTQDREKISAKEVRHRIRTLETQACALSAVFIPAQLPCCRSLRPGPSDGSSFNRPEASRES